MKSKSNATAARFAYEGLDRLIHERARLGVLTSLMTHPNGLSFVELKKLCALTDGNLARHLQILEAEKMVRISKEADGGRAQTTVRITAAGRSRYLEYLTILEQVVKDSANAKRYAEETPFSGKLKPLSS